MLQLSIKTRILAAIIVDACSSECNKEASTTYVAGVQLATGKLVSKPMNIAQDPVIVAIMQSNV